MTYTYRQCPCGTAKGIAKGDYDYFRGIPFAQAPRWESPVPITEWEDELNATYQGHACPQGKSYGFADNSVSRFYQNETVEKQTVIYSEDCLNLNILTPKAAKNAPVLVYIHGGGYDSGTGSATNYHGVAYCRRGVILVTINYRLNAFASAVGDGHSGNYGLQDQICALQWIQRNIAGFGGDPEKVTIMGESAGAMSVQNLILSPMAKGLFRGAILHSGGGILPRAFRIKGPEDMLALWEEVKQHFSVKTIDELKQIPPKELFIAWKTICSGNRRYACPATPVIDGEFIPDAPRALAEAGNVNPVPTIHLMLSEDMWPHTLYSAIIDWAQLMEKAGMPPVYGAYFDRAAPGSDHGAFHASDAKYAFGTLDNCWRPFTEVDHRISQNMIEYYVSFVKTGIPQAEGLPQWSPLSCKQQKFMHFGDEPCDMVDVPTNRLQTTEEKGKPFPSI